MIRSAWKNTLHRVVCVCPSSSPPSPSLVAPTLGLSGMPDSPLYPPPPPVLPRPPMGALLVVSRTIALDPYAGCFRRNSQTIPPVVPSLRGDLLHEIPD